MVLCCRRIEVGCRSIPTRFQQDAPLLATVRWGRGQAARHRRQAPFLDVGLDEHKSHLAEVDVHRAGSVGAHGGEQILRFEAMRNVVQFAAVAGEEDGTRTWTIADPDDIPLHEFRPVAGGRERLVVPAMTGRGVSHGVLVPAYKNRVSCRCRNIRCGFGNFKSHLAFETADMAWWPFRC